MISKTESLCQICGGTRKPGKTTYSVDLGDSVVVIRNVRAEVCVQCGEEWIDNDTAQELERITNEARKNHRQFEVVSL